MKVLHIYRTYFPDDPGGLQEAIRQVALGAARHGVQAEVFTLSPRPTPRFVDRPEARITRSRSWMAPASCDLGGPDAFATFRRLAREADLLHYHFPWPFADLLHLAVRPRTPAVLTYHSDIVRQAALNRVYAPLRDRLLGSVRCIVATSPAYARTSAVLSDPRFEPKVRVIPLGMADPGPASEPAAAAILQRLGLQPGQAFVLFIGVLRYYKGLHTLVQAACGVGAPVVIAGSGPEGAALLQQARKLSADNVRFAGQVSDAEKQVLLQACGALVLPSHLRSEAYGMVLVEAAMAGKPMVSCEIGTGTSFANLDGQTGLVVPPQDPHALAQALRALLEDTPLRLRYGAQARTRYERLLSGDAMGAAYAALYREVLDEAG